MREERAPDTGAHVPRVHPHVLELPDATRPGDRVEADDPAAMDGLVDRVAVDEAGGDRELSLYQ